MALLPFGSSQPQNIGPLDPFWGHNIYPRPSTWAQNFFFFFFAVATGPKRSLSRQLSDTRVYRWGLKYEPAWVPLHILGPLGSSSTQQRTCPVSGGHQKLFCRKAMLPFGSFRSFRLLFLPKFCPTTRPSVERTAESNFAWHIKPPLSVKWTMPCRSFRF